MRSFMLKKLLLAGIVLVGCAVGAAESYIDCIKQIEKWMIKEYSQTPIAYNVCKQKLAEIVKSELSEEQKISQLKAKFPEAFLKEEKPLVFKTPLTWHIHSLSLGYDFKESASSTTREVDIFKEVKELKHKTGKAGEDAITQRHALKAGINSEVVAQANVSFNPFKWLDSGASGKIGASGSYAFGRDSVTQSSELWSVSQQQTFASEQSRISEMLSQRGISNFHLTFTVTLTNNTAGTMYCDLAGAYIPVYMGSRACNKTAKPYERTADRLEIEPWRTKDVVFRMELDTTTARELARFMAENAPTIDIMKGGNLKIISDQSNDVIGDSQKRIETGKVKLRLPGLAAEWNIRLLNTSNSRPVTLREALAAVGEDIHAKFEHKVFTWQGDKLIAVSDIPVAEFAKGDTEERYAVFMQVGDQAFHPVTPELLEKSLLDVKNTELWVIDLGQLGKYDNLSPALQKSIFEKIKSLAEAPNNKAVHQLRMGRLYYKGIYVKKDDAQAVAWWRKAAEQGNTWAQNRLGFCYLRGVGVKKDEAKAVEWYQKAANQKNAWAQNCLGNCYLLGWGVKKDEAKAVEWYRKAAEQKNADAQVNLGNCYRLGWGVKKDENMAVELYRKAAKQDYARAQGQLGACYEWGSGVAKNQTKALEWYRKAAEQLEISAQLNLGRCYKNGIGVTKDQTKAFEWYSKAAEQGDKYAQFILGLCYHEGEGVTQDYAKAFEWYSKAAEQDFASAQFSLGNCYFNGEGVTKDYAEAVKWFRRAVEHGNSDAQYMLGLCYENGLGVLPNVVKAFDCYQKAAALGHCGAQCAMGDCYLHGKGVEKNETMAIKWYEMAAKQEHAPAQRKLGFCHFGGYGVSKNEAKGIKWWLMAAEQGDSKAQIMLGLCHVAGRGVPENKVEGVKWLRKAAEQGDKDAKEALKDLGY